jgi:prepilin signal peptidase PulO-like enzyme (type II secretory pathway)
MLVGLLALIIYDIRWYLLPNRVVFPLIGIVILQILLLSILKDDAKSLLLGGLWGLLAGGGIFWLIYQVSDGKWIGGGDVKLGWMLGLLLGGPAASLLMIFFASVLGSVVAIPLLITGKASRSTRLPFGPFLIAASIIVYLYGSTLVSHYKRLYGL